MSSSECVYKVVCEKIKTVGNVEDVACLQFPNAREGRGYIDIKHAHKDPE